MEIIESWEDQYANIYDPYPNTYAIVKHSKEEMQRYKIKEYEAMWMVNGELYSFGGSVGYRIADFDSVEEAQEFLLTGMALEDINPNIWSPTVEA